MKNFVLKQIQKHRDIYNIIILFIMALAIVGLENAKAQVNQNAGLEDDGFALGFGNGSTMVRRIRLQTINRLGCEGVGRFQDAILRVQNSIRSPRGFHDEFVLGFHRGYSFALRQAVHEVRTHCGMEHFRDEYFPGQFSGGMFCQVLVDAPRLVSSFPFEPLYENWSDGRSAEQQRCRSEFSQIVHSCAGSVIVDVMSVAQTVCR